MPFIKLFRYLVFFFFIAITAVSSKLIAQVSDYPDIDLTPPIDCVLGDDCWIVNYFDHDLGSNAFDYTCGPHSYDTHRGTDFAIKHLKAMRGVGVSVIASAPGKVLGIRDGMRDVSVNTIGREALNGKDCGNGVSIDHGGGLVTQYCHMWQGSIAVREGENVERGEKLGLVGLSGDTVFPHVHLTVRLNDINIDPFAPVTKSCDSRAYQDDKNLWSDGHGGLSYQPAIPYLLGFAAERPSAEKIRLGAYENPNINPQAPALVFWSDSFNLRNGDKIEMILKAPDGTILARQSKSFDSNKVR